MRPPAQQPAMPVLLALVLALILTPLPGLAQDDMRGLLPPGDLLRPEALLGALVGLEVDREIEADALVQELDRLNAWRVRRDGALLALDSLYSELDLLFNTGESAERPEDLEDLEGRIREAESRLQVLGDEGRELRMRIANRRERLTALTERAGQLADLLPDDTDSLTGVWDVRLVPLDETGVFTLYQSGTLLSGEYVLSGGWHGSLQGTVIGGRVFLERIDARKGRFADLRGDLGSSGLTIRGTWTERDLTANRAADGSWIAEKRRRGEPGS